MSESEKNEKLAFDANTTLELILECYSKLEAPDADHLYQSLKNNNANLWDVFHTLDKTEILPESLKFLSNDLKFNILKYM